MTDDDLARAAADDAAIAEREARIEAMLAQAAEVLP